MTIEVDPKQDPYVAPDAPHAGAGTQPLVSVIIDNYNYGRYLGAAIDSALHQTYPHVEVLVVDDGSTDQSRAVLAAYDDRVTNLFKENGGQASAFNLGFARCHGEIVIFLDADDVLLPQAAERVVVAFAEEPALAKVHFRMDVVDQGGRPTGGSRPPRHAMMLDGDLRHQYLSYSDDIWRLPTSGNAFAASALKRMMPIDEIGYRSGADTYLTHVAALFGPVRYLPEACAHYRLHGSNSYEIGQPRLNLARIRRNVTHSLQTHRHLNDYALSLGLIDRRRDIRSVSYVINRVISLSLQPQFHPIPEDTMVKLFGIGIAAALNRSDVRMPVRLAYIAWFALMAVAPRWLAWRLATHMVFPETRPRINRLLGVLGRG